MLLLLLLRKVSENLKTLNVEFDMKERSISYTYNCRKAPFGAENSAFSKDRLKEWNDAGDKERRHWCLIVEQLH